MRICVGTITRNRNNGLKQLIDSYSRMSLPVQCVVIFSVVENNSLLSVTDIVQSLEKIGRVYCEPEPELGIPFARNRVLEISLRENCDYTTFVDDDETVEQDWLLSLLDEIQSRNLDLVGGPVALHELDSDAKALNRSIWRGINRRNEKVFKSAEDHRRNNVDDKVFISTNNWMIDNKFLSRTNLRFDETLRFSGGSDTVFYRTARELGARTGWAPNAIVFETMPLTRLTFGYQYCRGRDQSIAAFRMKYPIVNLSVFLKSIIFIISKALTGLVLLLVAPLKRFVTLSAAARNFGLAVGRLKAIFGFQSTHYKKIHTV